MPTEVAYAQVEAQASIDGTTYDVHSFNTDFAINSIPTANVALAVGRDTTGQRTSAAHGTFSKFMEQQNATISLRMTGAYEPGGREWPGGFHKVFDGVTAGPNYRHQFGGIGMGVNMLHWLWDLQASHVLSDKVFSSLPTNFVNLGPLGPAAASTGDNILDLMVAIGAKIGVKVSEDMWTKGLKEVFYWLAKGDGMTIGGTGGGNAKAKAALDRMDGSGIRTGGAKCSLIGAGTSLEYAIERSLIKATFGAIGGHTFWQTLMFAFAQELEAVVVPTVEGAAVLPHIRSLKSPYKTIGAEEYETCMINGDTKLPINGVAIYGETMNDGAHASSKTPKPFDAHGYRDDSRDGMVVFEKAPFWLKYTSVDYLGTQSNSDIKASCAFGPSEEAPEKGEFAEAENPNPIIQAYCKSRYGQLIFKGRTGMLRGKLRFDISPGSIVKINCVGEKLGGNFGAGFVDTVYAHVYRVQTSITSGSPGMAFTALHLDSVRTEEENNTLGASTHPLYNNVWTGSYLSEELS